MDKPDKNEVLDVEEEEQEAAKKEPGSSVRFKFWFFNLDYLVVRR
jgi:hypothetical protein